MSGTRRWAGYVVRLGTAAAVLGLLSLAAIGTSRLAAPPQTVHAQAKQRTPVYPYHADPTSDIHYALSTAGMQHKRVLLDFGNNSCHACRMLYKYLHNAQNHPLVKYYYVVVRINVGAKLDKNLGTVHKYDVSLNKGLPALVVLERPGRVVHTEEFGKSHELSSASLHTFLRTWKPHPGTSKP